MDIRLLDVLLFLVPIFHVFNTPHIKVEECFSIHATHDVLMYGVGPANLHKYEHFSFPGAIERTFVGSILLAWISNPLLHLAKAMGLLRTKMDMQLSVRLTLCVLNGFGLWFVRRAASRRFGRSTGAFFTILSVTQFHVPFWMSRTIPNMFAFFFLNIGTALVLLPRKNAAKQQRRWLTAIALATSCGAIFRSELAAYVGPLALEALLRKKATFETILLTGLCSGFGSAALSTLVDSYFWDKWYVWPELAAVYFNVVLGKSADWGVFPFYTYFYPFLPKILLFSFPLVFLGLLVDADTRDIVISPLAYVVLLSFIKHKEWRFIVYVVPVLNVVAARGAAWLYAQRHQGVIHRLLTLGLIAGVFGNVAITAILTLVSKANYPGGFALSHINQHYADLPQNAIYTDNLAAHTGVSLFLSDFSAPFAPFFEPTSQNWLYDKTDDQTDFSSYEFVVAEPSDTFASSDEWRIVEKIQAFDGIRPREVLKGGLVGMKDRLWVLRRSRPPV